GPFGRAVLLPRFAPARFAASISCNACCAASSIRLLSGSSFCCSDLLAPFVAPDLPPSTLLPPPRTMLLPWRTMLLPLTRTLLPPSRIWESALGRGGGRIELGVLALPLSVSWLRFDTVSSSLVLSLRRGGCNGRRGGGPIGRLSLRRLLSPETSLP